MANSVKIFNILKTGRQFASMGRSRHITNKIINNFHTRENVSTTRRFLCSAAAKPDIEYHSIIKDTEKVAGESSKHEFQAETRMLLDIVARSLYSDKEVFIRELISNASDALEKFRYEHLSGETNLAEPDRKLEIHLSTDKQNRILIIQDTGIGMTHDELVSNLGTIARSGSKAFLEQVKQKGSEGNSGNIIGQFGVGFYSAFMVASKLEVFSRSAQSETGYKWTSDGTGSYEIAPADGVQFGTKIVLHLKPECREFADDDTLKTIIGKYSNFVGSPIFLNGSRINVIQPVWLMDAKSVTEQQHYEFYRYVSGSYDRPRFTLHYNTDVPLSIHALLYFPEGKPGLFEMSRETQMGVALYTRRVMIMNKTDNILPKWLRFVKGVVDSDDIPLNLSRELLQNSSLIRKLTSVLTSKILKFLQEQAKKHPQEYEKFYTDYGIFLKEGIITNHDQQEKEDIAKLLRFESSHKPAGEKVSLDEYSKEGQDRRSIYYLSAPSRSLAESSPYYESLKQRNQEVLFCFEPYDELVLMQLREYKGRALVSAEKDMREDKKSTDMSSLEDDPSSLKRSELDGLTKWLSDKLKGMAASVSATTRLDRHPCVVTVEEMAAARHFIRTQSQQLNEERRYALLQPRLEVNPKHPLIKKLHGLIATDPELADMLAKQLFANAMVGAGLVDDPRTLVTSINELLQRALDKH